MTDQKYWDRVLRQEGLSMERGLPPKKRVHRQDGSRKTVRLGLYVGSSSRLATVAEEQFRKRRGKVSPSGRGPDK